MTDPIRQPEPETSPFVESDAEASLRRIAEVTREVHQAKDGMDKAKADYKAAKETYNKIRQEADLVIEGEITELPLFPRTRPTTAAASPVDPNAPGATWLSNIEGIPASVAIKLGEKGIQTIGELGDFTAKGGKLTDLDGIGESTAEKIINAMARFWADRGAA